MLVGRLGAYIQIKVQYDELSMLGWRGRRELVVLAESRSRSWLNCGGSGMRRRESVVLLVSEIPMSRKESESTDVVEAPRTPLSSNGCGRGLPRRIVAYGCCCGVSASKSSAVSVVLALGVSVTSIRTEPGFEAAGSLSRFSSSSSIEFRTVMVDSSSCTRGWRGLGVRFGEGSSLVGRRLKNVDRVRGVRPSLPLDRVPLTGVDGPDGGKATLSGSNMLSTELLAMASLTGTGLSERARRGEPRDASASLNSRYCI